MGCCTSKEGGQTSAAPDVQPEVTGYLSANASRTAGPGKTLPASAPAPTSEEIEREKDMAAAIIQAAFLDIEKRSSVEKA
mmetsp:Transcript_14115/g.43126  ORF Transcript_14115/g.43126 Transcript_14115/m.43126 type:complete len:80 (-) Transcript_14115:432-671(-)